MLNSARGGIQRVIYIQFDNTHFRRDNPNVPSDLEQIPSLLNFMKGKGALLTNDHTVIIAHTASGILSSLTGVYGDRMGVPVSNSFRYFKPDGTSSTGVSFAYWTDSIFDPANPTGDPAKQTDLTPNMLTADGKNAPAPFAAFTRAGCDVGLVATANLVLENTGPDVPKVFGVNSPEAQEAAANPAKAQADFVGIAVHCAQSSDVCAAAQGGRPDLLPDEPNGYAGFMGLFGHKYVAPVISPGGPLKDLNGYVIQDTASPSNVGFPGFDGMQPWVSLAYVAAMQESGIPVTYAYISDAHDNHLAGGITKAFGPGEAGYVAQLQAYDAAFQKFFDRLAKAGINETNTLFVITVDEGDHFVGSPPSPSSCDGVRVACTYSKVGEINANLPGLLVTQLGSNPLFGNFSVHSDSAPTIYIKGNPGPTHPDTRLLAKSLSKLTAVNPISGATDTLALGLADPVGMRLLHMITADPARTPSLVMFGDPNYFFFAGAANCSQPCVALPSPAGSVFAWNHGDYTNEIATTWLGMVGPGVRKGGVDSTTWSDHTDVRPTILALLGLQDLYAHDGRVLVEVLQNWATPPAANKEIFTRLAKVYKQINAPFGELSVNALKVSTAALKSADANDATYTRLTGQIAAWTSQRDGIASEMRAMLNSAAFDNVAINHRSASFLIDQATDLLKEVERAAKLLK
ncbi:MAG TPA: hypothetical protein VMI34_17650 [Candidatus Bathyarchaeia archaeon]|nr:hypothetical protein [Candidatus Bathyarchaeia archaeon]